MRRQESTPCARLSDCKRVSQRYSLEIIQILHEHGCVCDLIINAESNVHRDADPI